MAFDAVLDAKITFGEAVIECTGASFPIHVSGTHLSTDPGECHAFGSLRTTNTKGIGSVSHEECLLQWVWIAVIVVVHILAILVVAIFWWIVRQSRGRMQIIKEAALEMQIKEGLSTVKHLACPLFVPPQATCCHPATQNCDKHLNS